MKPMFRICRHCGNLVGVIHDSGVPMICCGQPMDLLEANTTDASTEKHVPQVQLDGDTLTVTVGSVAHPMEPEHLIQWIYVKTQKGGMRKALQPGEEPKAVFCVKDDKALEVYAYCNLHGLWMAQV